ncbi:hypothetical protein [Methylocapsa acidiphila]|uniref:hypothetical protein n=1 Tax=Methylocapsa acidiphila TaxID=133552 RepID=UPI000417083C|nr:hypothetical protein [Methylocapsa acidiphila]
MKRNRIWRLRRAAFVLATFGGALLAGPLHAEDKKATGSPFDTIAKTKIFADRPEAKEFVRASRPPSEALGYLPTARTDPERPAPRTEAELKALEAELERGAAHNQASAGRRSAAKAAPSAHAQGTKADKTLAD